MPRRTRLPCAFVLGHTTVGRSAMTERDFGVAFMYAAFGYEPSKAAVCPRIVAGKRCRRARDCVCRKYETKAFDHARMWKDHNGRHVFTSEPHGLQGEEIVALVSDMEDLGLTVSIDGRSHWSSDGAALLIIITTSEPHDSSWYEERRTHSQPEPGSA